MKTNDSRYLLKVIPKDYVTIVYSGTLAIESALVNLLTLLSGFIFLFPCLWESYRFLLTVCQLLTCQWFLFQFRFISLHILI